MIGKRGESSETSFGFGVVELIIAIMVVLFIFLPIIMFVMQQFQPDRDSANALRNINTMILELKQEYQGEPLSTITPIRVAENDIIKEENNDYGAKMCIYSTKKGKNVKCFSYKDLHIEPVTLGSNNNKVYNVRITLSEKDGKEKVTLTAV
jgi:hypothetical protein